MKRIIYSFFILLLVANTGCKKSFLDINQNPNSATDESITPNLILPSVLHAMAGRMAISYDVEGRWMGYWTRSGTYGPSTEEESYHITTTFEASEWSGWFNILNDVNVMEKKANASGETFYEGIAKGLKSIGFMYLVDQYNNVPYSKAFDLGGNILPAYDKGQDIYIDLLTQLDAAATLITQAELGGNLKIEEADILFHGDKINWRKLINTQRLKLLVRQSQVPGFSPSAEIAKITSDGSGFLESGETASVQPVYVVDNNKQNPFWDTYKRLYTGDVADNYNRANNYVLNLFRNNNDVRYQRVFSPVTSGCSCSPPVANGSYYGYNYGEVVTDPDQPKAANSSDVAGPGLAKSATQAQWLFTSVESKFLQAEAIQRGWLPGDAKTAYEDAVRESFIWLNVPGGTATANTYLAQANAIVSWTAATTPDAKINLIVMQKYLALIGINNFEAWVDYRRLGVPASLPLSLSPSRGGYIIPLRLTYPQNEYNYNAANVAAEGDIDPQNSTIFWDR